VMPYRPDACTVKRVHNSKVNRTQVPSQYRIAVNPLFGASRLTPSGPPQGAFTPLHGVVRCFRATCLLRASFPDDSMTSPNAGLSTTGLLVLESV